MSESIYNLVPTEYYVPEKMPMFQSNHDPKGTLTGSTFGCKGTTRLPGAGQMTKRNAANFGPRYEDVPKKPSFLRKKETTAPEDSALSTFKYEFAKEKKAGVPSRNNVPVMGIKTSKNFITANAVEAILAAPRVNNVDSDYTRKEDYGKPPAYLADVKEEIRRENEMIDRYVKDRMGYQEDNPEQIAELSDHERMALVEQLKAKWNSVNAEYQKMTHLVNLDSCGLVRRKMKGLEADIALLTKAGPVLVRG